MEEERVIRFGISGEKDDASKFRRLITVEIPADLELSEEQMKKIADKTGNEIIDTIRNEQTKRSEFIAKGYGELISMQK